MCRSEPCDLELAFRYSQADTSAVERFFCVRTMATPVMGGPCVGAFGLTCPVTGTPTRTVPLTQIGVWGVE